MGDRLSLHATLKTFLPNVYFQPPSNIQMVYPCIVYNKTNRDSKFADNKNYLIKQGYSITVIDRNPDGNIADLIEETFQYCTITQYFISENLNHTTLQLYY